MACFVILTIRLTFILFFLAWVGSAHSLKCSTCSPCSQDTAQSVDCSSEELCLTEKHGGVVTKRCASREEVRGKGINLGGVGQLSRYSNGEGICACNDKDYCDCGIGVGSLDDLEEMKKWAELISTSLPTLSSKWSYIKTFLISKLETPWTLWNDLTSSVTPWLDAMWEGIKSVLTWDSRSMIIEALIKQNQREFPSSLPIKCFSCSATCSQDATQSVNCDELCYTEKHEGTVTKKGCATLEDLRKIGVYISDGRTQVIGKDNIIVHVVTISNGEIKVFSTEDKTETFYCRGEDLCNGN